MSVSAEVQRCGVGIRGVAMAIDSVVWFVLFFVATFPIAALSGDLQATGGGMDAAVRGAPAMAAVLLWVGLGIGYHTVFEWRSGKSLGKYLVSIRVVNVHGSPVSLRTAVIRNVLRLVDFFPVVYLVGIGAMVVLDGDQRLGDRVAKTMVVRA